MDRDRTPPRIEPEDHVNAGLVTVASVFAAAVACLIVVSFALMAFSVRTAGVPS